MDRLEKAFNRAVLACRESITALGELTREEERVYGFVHNDRDLDYIIDTIDYAQGPITFKKFHKIMMEEKNNSRNGGNRNNDDEST